MAPEARELLANNPQARELLLLLWCAPDRKAGIAIAELPDSLRNEDLLAECQRAQLIRFLGRNLSNVLNIPGEIPCRVQLTLAGSVEAHRLATAPRTLHQNEPGAKTPAGFLGGTALADALGVHATRRDAFFRQLERQRMSLGDDCWHEVRDPRPNSPRFLYRADSPKLRDLAAGYKTPKPA